MFYLTVLLLIIFYFNLFSLFLILQFNHFIRTWFNGYLYITENLVLYKYRKHVTWPRLVLAINSLVFVKLVKLGNCLVFFHLSL